MPRRDSLQEEAARKKRRQAEAAEQRDSQAHYPPLVSSLGNATAQRLLRSTESDEQHPAVHGSLEGAIEAQRGGDAGAQLRLGGALQADLSGVRVHDDAEANDLHHAVEAEAFTTGSDVFFREGQYSPRTADGRDRGAPAAR